MDDEERVAQMEEAVRLILTAYAMTDMEPEAFGTWLTVIAADFITGDAFESEAVH